MSAEEAPADLQSLLSGIGSSSPCVISFSPFFMNQLSTHLMEHQVDDLGMNALYICVGRPHIFIKKLLMSRGVKVRNIHFMELTLSTGIRTGSQCRIMDDTGPIEVPATFNLFRSDVEIQELNLSDVNVIVLDNLYEICIFNSDEKVENFVCFLKGISERNGIVLELLQLRQPGAAKGGMDLPGMGFKMVDVPDPLFL